ncbi:aldehyde ferredoxin oxidoreductase [Clostridium bovifaecis]|uniref:Aldehyde ferredoxin oxidoreductase n=1 Tax=Clostridium bovifaecis TaxID=2184719 RepID=A0A6I6EQC2_9CLOT|nr:aldehyde ferredoxin oxidoreductase [Clostridium bovifaecis]
MKLIRVNTKSKVVKEENFDRNILLGNRGLVAKIINEEVNPKCDPLGPENKIVFCTGLFAGTIIPTSGRLSVGGKSPLTGGIKEANAGGNVASSMAAHGIKAIIFEDKPEDNNLYIFRVKANGEFEYVLSNEYREMGTYELVEKLYERYGNNISVCAIGPAGERRCKAATLQVSEQTTGHPARAAARGGLGAVMGSKNVKALVIEKPEKRVQIEYEDKALFDDAARKIIDIIKNHQNTKGLSMMGTSVYTDATAPMGALPVKNFKGEFLPEEKLQKINAKAFITRAKEHGGRTGVACQPGCIVKCSNIINNEKGEMITSGLEYETLALCGPNCDINDLDKIAKMDRICDDFGIDTIEFGNAIAIAMDAGIIEWGNFNEVLRLTEEMYRGEGLGNIIAHGAKAVGNALNHHRVPTVKNQALAAYDPRAIKGLGVTYATSTMGADHTAGHTLGAAVKHSSKEGQVELSKQYQRVVAVADNTMCLFGWVPISKEGAFGEFIQALKGIYGGEWDINRLFSIGAETLTLERNFNVKAGLTSNDDRLPEFFLRETAPSIGTTFDITDKEIDAMYTS